MSTCDHPQVAMCSKVNTIQESALAMRRLPKTSRPRSMPNPRNIYLWAFGQMQRGQHAVVNCREPGKHYNPCTETDQQILKTDSSLDWLVSQPQNMFPLIAS